MRLAVQTLGLVEWQAGRLPDARRAFWQGTKRFPGYSSLWSAWGKVEVSSATSGPTGLEPESEEVCQIPLYCLLQWPSAQLKTASTALRCACHLHPSLACEVPQWLPTQQALEQHC